jgi:hypothetical protein
VHGGGTQLGHEWQGADGSMGWESMLSELRLNAAALRLSRDASGPALMPPHAGTPEGAVTATVGSLCIDKTNGELYVKNTGTGNTGWKKVTHA